MTKNGYYGDEGLNLAWDLGAKFLGIPNWVIGRFLTSFFFYFGLKGVVETCVGSFLVYLFFGGGGSIKRYMRNSLTKTH